MGEEFDRGVPGYRPRRLRGIDAVTAAHGDRPAGLTRRVLTHVWLVHRGGDLADGMVAIALDVDGTRLVVSNGWDENRVETGDASDRSPVWARHALPIGDGARGVAR